MLRLLFHEGNLPIMIDFILQNYNKSRIYSARGVRLVQIKLDDQIIFHGEIARSSGELKGSLSSFGDVSTILHNDITSDSLLGLGQLHLYIKQIFYRSYAYLLT